MDEDKSLSFKIRGLEDLQKFFKDLPYGTKKAALEAAAKYLVGDKNHGLAYYPDRVSHGADNPYRWQSDKQRRAYFATNGFGGGIPYQRTDELSEGWEYKPLNNGYGYRIDNKVPYATYVQGESQQIGHKADRWRQVGKILADNINGAIRSAQQAVDRFIKNKEG